MADQESDFIPLGQLSLDGEIIEPKEDKGESDKFIPLSDLDLEGNLQVLSPASKEIAREHGLDPSLPLPPGLDPEFSTEDEDQDILPSLISRGISQGIKTGTDVEPVEDTVEVPEEVSIGDVVKGFFATGIQSIAELPAAALVSLTSARRKELEGDKTIPVDETLQDTFRKFPRGGIRRTSTPEQIESAKTAEEFSKDILSNVGDLAEFGKELTGVPEFDRETQRAIELGLVLTGGLSGITKRSFLPSTAESTKRVSQVAPVDSELTGIVSDFTGLELDKSEDPLLRKLSLAGDEIALSSLFGLGLHTIGLGVKGLKKSGEAIDEKVVPLIKPFAEKTAQTEWGKALVSNIAKASEKTNKVIESTYGGLINSYKPFFNIERATRKSTLQDGLRGTPDTNALMNLGDNIYAVGMRVHDDAVPVYKGEGKVLEVIPESDGLMGIQQAIEEAGGNWSQALRYKEAKRLIKDEELGRSIASNRSIDEARQLVESSKNKEWAKVTDAKFNKFFDDILQHSKSGDQLDDDSIVRIQSTYGDSFFPLRRDVATTFQTPRQADLSVGTALGEATGGTAPLKDPSEALAMYLQRETISTHRNVMLNKMVDILDSADEATWNKHFVTPKAIYQKQVGFGEATGSSKVADDILSESPEEPLVSLIQPTTQELDNGANPVISFLRDGKRIQLEMNNDSNVWKSMSILQPVTKGEPSLINRLGRQFGETIKRIEQFSITSRPGFLAKTTLRDGIQAQIFTIAKKDKDTPLIVEGLQAVMEDVDPLLKQYKLDTGGLGTSRYINLLKKEQQDLLSADDIRQLGHTSLPITVAKAPINTLMEFANRLENASRFAEYKRVLEETGDRVLATRASKEVTVNFRQMGGWEAIRNANKYVMFLNVALQSADRVARRIIQDPDSMGKLSTRFYSVPALINHHNNKDNPDFAKIPMRSRRDNLVVAANGTFVEFPYQIGLGATFAGIPTAVYDEFMETENLDRETARQVGRAAILMTGIDAGLFPAAADLVGIGFLDKELSTGIEIRPGQESDAALYRVAEEVFGVQSKKVEKLSRKLFNEFSKSIERTTEDISREWLGEGETPAAPPWPLVTLHDFVKRKYSGNVENVNNIWYGTQGIRDRISELEKQEEEGLATFRDLQELDSLITENPGLEVLDEILESGIKEIRELSKEQNRIDADLDMDAESKTNEINEIQREIEDLALELQTELENEPEVQPFMHLQGFSNLENNATQLSARMLDAVREEFKNDKPIEEGFNGQEEIINFNNIVDLLGGAVQTQKLTEEEISGRALSLSSTSESNKSQMLDRLGLIDGFFQKLEGGLYTKGYVPWDGNSADWNNSGVTVGEGIDLNVWGKEDNLKRLKLEASLKKKIKKYSGKTKRDAVNFLKKNPLELTKKEAIDLSEAVQDVIFKDVTRFWNTQSVKEFMDLTPAQRTVIFDYGYQRGTRGLSRSPWFSDALEGNWKEVARKLRSETVDTRRRIIEAKLLEEELNNKTNQDPPKPSAEDTSILINNPALLEEFNKEFGKGVGEKIIRRFT